MVEIRQAAVPPLNQLYVYVTDACNCACIHCWIVSGKKPEGGNHFIAPEILEKAIEEARPLGLTSLKWTGGEPTIHPDFPALLAIQKKHGLKASMESNGMRITAELAQTLSDSGVYHVSVSLDGAKAETHDAIRGVRGSYDRAMIGIGNLVGAGFKPQIIMSLMRRNVAELEEILELAKRVGAGSVKFNIVQPNLRGEDLHAAGETLPVAELIELNKRVEKEMAPRFSFPIYFDVPLAFRSLSSILADGASSCGIRTILGLLADGSYAVCGIGDNIPEMVFGQVGDGDLDDIWRNHSVLMEIREGLPDHLQGICERCLMKYRCLGSCVAQNYHDTKKLIAEFWFCREAVTLGLFPHARSAMIGE